ncbi:MAG: aminotransferase class I/II-fold pyridoxal phosphate-dependent enzyme [Clostridiales bacterium]|nr:aminotransferase class I/II-fold pyridoxal phosphate-dependent enzyme [Clostridiales bacterium]
MKVPFNQPYIAKNQDKYLKEAARLETDYLSKVHGIFKQDYQVEDVILTTSASNAIELILLALDLPKGSEVIMPSYTYPAACNTIIRYGYQLVLCDSNRNTLTMEVEDIIDKISRKTSCIIPCHYGGASCNMDKLMEICHKKNIKVIEDAALSFGAKYKDRYLGTIGHAGVISFDKTKNISAETGGILLLNSLSDKTVKRLHYLYDNGTNKYEFLQGEVKNYSWKLAGLSAKMSNLHGALLFAQLEYKDEIFFRRKVLFEQYKKGLKNVCVRNHWHLPIINSYNENNYHVFYLVLNNNARREKLRIYLLDREIKAQTHYQPLHSSSMGENIGYNFVDFPNTNHITNCVLRLPLNPMLSSEQIDYVIESIKEFAS